MGEEGKGFPYIMQHFALERLIMAINGHARAEYALSIQLIICRSVRHSGLQ
jgi:alkylation response protein AidB-like acyl-CoA dehydrogenase